MRRWYKKGYPRCKEGWEHTGLIIGEVKEGCGGIPTKGGGRRNWSEMIPNEVKGMSKTDEATRSDDRVERDSKRWDQNHMKRLDEKPWRMRSDHTADWKWSEKLVRSWTATMVERKIIMTRAVLWWFVTGLTMWIGKLTPQISLFCSSLSLNERKQTDFNNFGMCE